MIHRPSYRSPFLVLVVLPALSALAGCSGSGSLSVAVAPAHGPVLTCSTQMMEATVTGSSNQVVSWRVTDDSSHGTIDEATGLFTAPIAMPTPSTATVVATAMVDGKTSGVSLLTLGTAFPSAARPITGSAGASSFDTGTFVHSVAAKGNRVYAVWSDDPTGGTTVRLKVARSDDGGATWMAPVTALTAICSRRTWCRTRSSGARRWRSTRATPTSCTPSATSQARPMSACSINRSTGIRRS